MGRYLRTGESSRIPAHLIEYANPFFSAVIIADLSIAA
jgi:hypothetical protein